MELLYSAAVTVSEVKVMLVSGTVSVSEMTRPRLATLPTFLKVN